MKPGLKRKYGYGKNHLFEMVLFTPKLFFGLTSQLLVAKQKKKLFLTFYKKIKDKMFPIILCLIL